MKLRKTFICELFRSKVYFYVGMPYEDALLHFVNTVGIEVDPLFKKPSPMMYGCVLFDREGACGNYMVWLADDDYYAMTHECVHLAYRILETNQIALNEHTQEFYANYVEFWVRKFWKAISKQSKAGRKKHAKH